MPPTNDQPPNHADAEALAGAGRRTRRWRPRFSLLALMLFVTLCCLVLAGWFRPQPFVSEALFRVRSVEPTVLGGEGNRFDAREFEVFRNTQAAYVTSHAVLQAAAKDPQIKGLLRLQRRKDPVAWLAKNIEVDFPGDGELMAIRLRGNQRTAADDRLIVDAVAKAYEKEVIFRRRNERLRTLDDSRQLLHRQMQMLEVQAEDVIKLERELADGTEASTSLSADLVRHKAELATLQESNARLSLQVQLTQVELEAPERVQLVQPATTQSK